MNSREKAVLVCGIKKNPEAIFVSFKMAFQEQYSIHLAIKPSMFPIPPYLIFSVLTLLPLDSVLPKCLWILFVAVRGAWPTCCSWLVVRNAYVDCKHC